MPQHRLPILIVEDSPEDYEALVRAFAKVGISNPVYRFSYGEDAYDFLKQRGRYFKHGAEERPGVMILDLNLPGTDGLRVLRGIREDPGLRAIPVIVLSTSSNAREIEACYLAGANSYMVKPSSPADFVEGIRRFKEFWLDAATLPGKADAPDVVVTKGATPGRQPAAAAAPPPPPGISGVQPE
jgi:CheY-like chemotaxis protein